MAEERLSRTARAIESVTLTADGSISGLGAQLLRDRTDDGFTLSDLPEMGRIGLMPEQILDLQVPSCIF